MCVPWQHHVCVVYLLHTVVHRQKRLQSFPLQHVGELHVDGLHGAGVTHDPVLVLVWSVVITGSAERKTRGGRGLHGETGRVEVTTCRTELCLDATGSGEQMKHDQNSSVH